MTENDRLIISVVEGLDVALDTNVKALQAAAEEWAATDKKAKLAARGEVPANTLHCDDDMNNGCMSIHGPSGVKIMNLNLRTAPSSMLKSIAAELYSMNEAETHAKLAYTGEGGHSVKEWLEDVVSCYNATCDENTAREELLSAVSKVKKAEDAYEKNMSIRNKELSLLSHEFNKEIQIRLMADDTNIPLKMERDALPQKVMALLSSFHLAEVEYEYELDDADEEDENEYDEDEDKEDENEDSSTDTSYYCPYYPKN